jgi:DNA primase
MSLTEAKNLILAQSSLATLIGEAVTLHKQSGKLVGCCPFHGEKTASFYVYDDHYHCYGCGAHGDAITFVRKKYGLNYVPSLRWLADKYGINVSSLEQSAEDINRLKLQAQQGKILLAAQQFFVSQLWKDDGRHEEGKDARRYFHERGFDEDVCRSFGFGLAPNAEHALHKHLHALGFHDVDLEQASLVTTYNSRSFDFFRHRVIVPIHDAYGRIIAFGGRTLGGATQKYKNSRYNKGAVLFARHRARQAMGQKHRALVVEGYFDALQLHLHGFEETVACQGTALTQEHLQQLNAATKEVYLVFDGDSPGRQASLKIISLALNFPELQFKVVELPKDEDPDVLVRRGGSQALQSLIAAAQDLIFFGIQSKLQGAAPTAIPHLIHEEFIPWLASIPQPIKQSYLCRKISELSGVQERIISQELAAHSKRLGKASSPSASAAPLVRVTPRTTPQTAHSSAPLPPLVYELIGHLYFAFLHPAASGKSRPMAALTRVGGGATGKSSFIWMCAAENSWR